METKDRPRAASGDSTRAAANSAIGALSRIFAILILMAMLGAGGGFLDRALGTHYFMLVGFLLGIALAMVGMFYVVKVAEIERKKAVRSESQGDAAPLVPGVSPAPDADRVHEPEAERGPQE